MLLAGGGWFLWNQTTSKESIDPQAGTTLDGPALKSAGCAPVEYPEVLEASHIASGQSHEPYSSSPPTSGPHLATPADFDYYPFEVEPEQLVHNLEHGQIVAWFRPDGDVLEETALGGVSQTSEGGVLAVPYPDLEPGYYLALTAWGAIQMCESVSIEAIDAFRAEFQGRGPEQVGVPIFEAAF